ncbi:MAG: hypothetical protein IPQ01_15405 [Zoogloea sp.]|nr:hypothetical protein [Zoogloea sp.]
MDVRKLAIALCFLILLAVGGVLYFQIERPVDVRGGSDQAIAERIEVLHGPALRAMGVASLGVAPGTDDVVVVFSDGGKLGRKVAGRLPGLAGGGGCGPLDVGVAVGKTVSIWGDSDDPVFQSRLDCVIGEVLGNAARLRDPD